MYFTRTYAYPVVWGRITLSSEVFFLLFFRGLQQAANEIIDIIQIRLPFTYLFFELHKDNYHSLFPRSAAFYPLLQLRGLICHWLSRSWAGFIERATSASKTLYC